MLYCLCCRTDEKVCLYIAVLQLTRRIHENDTIKRNVRLGQAIVAFGAKQQSWPFSNEIQQQQQQQTTIIIIIVSRRHTRLGRTDFARGTCAIVLMVLLRLVFTMRTALFSKDDCNNNYWRRVYYISMTSERTVSV